MGDVHNLPEGFNSRQQSVDPPSGGGDDGGMSTYVTKAEMAAEFSAVRAEMKLGFSEMRAEFRGELHRTTHELVKWIVGTAIAMAAAGITVMTFVLNNAAPKAPSTQQPTVIVVPAPQAPPASR